VSAAALRRARTEEAAAVAGVINAAFVVERFFVDGDRTDAEEVRAYMRKGSFLVLEEAGALAGCVYVERRGERGYFGLLAVDPARTGQGLGRTLVAAAEEELRRAGCRAVDIQVVSLRAELPPFYRRLGYAETGTAPFEDPRLKRECHFIRMAKELPEGPARP
jgi:N-acetylglutamate synthase-like GNAT family acetyltransferase